MIKLCEKGKNTTQMLYNRQKEPRIVEKYPKNPKNTQNLKNRQNDQNYVRKVKT